MTKRRDTTTRQGMSERAIGKTATFHSIPLQARRLACKQGYHCFSHYTPFCKKGIRISKWRKKAIFPKTGTFWVPNSQSKKNKKIEKLHLCISDFLPCFPQMDSKTASTLGEEAEKHACVPPGQGFTPQEIETTPPSGKAHYKRKKQTQLTVEEVEILRDVVEEFLVAQPWSEIRRKIMDLTLARLRRTKCDCVWSANRVRFYFRKYQAYNKII